MKGILGWVAAALALALAPAGAAADNWLPHPADATWTYTWSDSTYAPTPTTEKVTVKSQKGSSFVLAWTTADQGNADGAVSSSGVVSFQETNAGIVNTDWSSTPPPPAFPVLCPQILNCGNALSSTLYNLIWGTRQPLLVEPVLKGLTWASSGGAANDVSSTSSYLGRQNVVVPAFPAGVTAARIVSRITQAGALGDPYGSGTRTIWWVYGVGPVKIEFDHAGGSSAPVMIAELQSTNQTPAAIPGDSDFFPLVKGTNLTYRWTNTKHLRSAETDRFTIDAVVNGTARLKLVSTSGPIRAVGSYGFSKRLDGLTNLWGTTTSATKLTFPTLGPAGAPASERNRFTTALDFFTFGINPLLPSYPAAGDHWSTSKSSNDFKTYGVDGQTRVLGMKRIRVPSGTYNALVVRSTLAQRGFPFGSGTRTCWFAPGVGLVKIVFAHGDGSVSTVVRVR